MTLVLCTLSVPPMCAGELYVCGLGGSDHISGDRLRAGGDCATAEQVHADPRRVAAACAALRGMTNMISEATPPDVVQVSALLIAFCVLY